MRWASVARTWIPRLLLLTLSVVGWGLFIRIIVVNVVTTVANVGNPGAGLGWDTYAYWLAGSRVLDGLPIYWADAIDQLGAYFYAPPFAQLWAPVSVLPWEAADWAWRLLGLLCIRYIAGSWMVTGLWWLYPGTLYELSFGNVTFQVAALTVAGLRGRAEGILPATLLKFSAAAVVPFIWIRRPQARKGLLVGGFVTLVVVLISLLTAPGLWSEYLGALGSQGNLAFQGTDILHLLPSPAADFLLRIAIAIVMVVVAIRVDSPHLAYAASVLAIPTIWPQRLSVLFALLTLENDHWLRRYLWPWSKVDKRTLAGTTDSPPGRAGLEEGRPGATAS